MKLSTLIASMSADEMLLLEASFGPHWRCARVRFLARELARIRHARARAARTRVRYNVRGERKQSLK